MDPMKKLISSFMLDVNNYLTFVSDYGKPNHKYFNFVLNRMGLMHLFTSKAEIFPLGNNAMRFVDGVNVALKNRFLLSDEENQSSLKRAAIVFLMSKIYFTDDIGNILKLRLINEEWNVFVSFMSSIKLQPLYLPTRIMFYQLFSEKFFKFTMKNKALALDYGTVDNEAEVQLDPNVDIMFWNDISKEVKTLERNDIAALRNLEALRDEAMQPFEAFFPERQYLREVLEEFEQLKEAVVPVLTAKVPQSVTHKQVLQARRDLLKTSGFGSTSHRDKPESEDIEVDSDIETAVEKKHSKKRIKRRQAGSSKESKAEQKDTSSSESENEKDFKRMVRSLGYNSQNVMKGIGAETFSEKLKRCYEKIE